MTIGIGPSRLVYAILYTFLTRCWQMQA